MTHKDLRKERFSLRKTNLLLINKRKGFIKGSPEFAEITQQIKTNKNRIKDINSKLKYSIYGLRILNSIGFIVIITMLGHIIKLLGSK